MLDKKICLSESFNWKTRAMMIRLQARVARRPGRWRRVMNGKGVKNDLKEISDMPQYLQAA